MTAVELLLKQFIIPSPSGECIAKFQRKDLICQRVGLRGKRLFIMTNLLASNAVFWDGEAAKLP
jgi:hypothetical protein